MARPRKGELPRENHTIRLEPDDKKFLIDKFGGVQAAVDDMIEKLKKKNSGAMVNGRTSPRKRPLSD